MAADRDAALRAWSLKRDETSREACLLAWLPVVKRVWQRLRMSLPPAAAQVSEDLMQCGVIGLMQALESWQEGRGANFETWARLRIRGAMLDELRRLDWISKERRRRWKALRQAVQRLEQSLQRSCNEEELARYLGLSLEALHESLLENSPGSMVFLDAFGEDAGLSLHDRLADARQKGADYDSLEHELKQGLAQAIGQLPAQARFLLVLVLDQELGHQEAAAVMGVSPGRVSQIYAKAVLQLQAALAPKFDN